MTAPIKDRFEAKYIPEPNSGCWLWMGAASTSGHGCIGEDLTRRVLGAHRVSWELHRGPIPDGLSVLHRCDNPPCVNPDHLFLGTQADNMADRNKKGRTQRVKGSNKVNAKLTENQALSVKRSSKKLREIAAEFNIHLSTASYIRTGRSWKHLGD